MEKMVEGLRKATHLENAVRKLRVGLVVFALALSGIMIVLTSLSSGPATAGWWSSRELVTDGFDNNDGSIEPVVTTDRFGNVHVVWVDGVLDGSGPDADIFYRKWNSTTQVWEARVLVTDDNANNTFGSVLPDVETDPFGNVHIVWRQNGDLGGSGGDTDIFLRTWNATANTWEPRVLVSDDPSNSGSREPRLAADHLGNLHVTWHDGSPFDPGPGIQYMKWNATNDVWEQRMVVYNNSVNFLWSDIAVDPYGNAHIIWSDQANISGASSNLNDSDIFHRSFSASANMWGSITHVNYDDESDSNHSNVGGIASDIFGNIHVIWQDEGEQSGNGGDPDIFYRKWNSTRKSWEPRVLVSNHPANIYTSIRARICTDQGGGVHIVWLDKSDVDGAGPNRADVFYKKWDALTDTWEGTISLTNDLLDSYNSYRPDIASDNLGNIFVVWNDPSGLLGSGSDHDVYLRRYESDIVLPDYMPIEVSPPTTKYVLTGSTNQISSKVYNGGESTGLSSTIAFYETANPLPPFYTGTVPPLGRAERSTLFESTWIAPLTPGTYEITIEVDYGDAIVEISEENNFYRIQFIVEKPPFPPPPPANLTTRVVNGDDILLNWTMSNTTSIDQYLIYRSTDQREFDFSTPLYNTTADTEPLRTDWTDVDAAGPSALREHYYVVRSVNQMGMVSITSNTAGKWTEGFSGGRGAFSLPLKPFASRNISWFSENMPGTEFIRWMNSTGHWATHYPSMGEGVNDIPTMMGDSYEISLLSPTNFTFCGYPASMIRFHEGMGDSIAFRKGLSAQVEANDISLSWETVTGAIAYLVFRSDERNGLHDLSLSPIANTTDTHWIDSGVVGSWRSEYYYMVIPVGPSGSLGGSTYSIGVFAEEYQSGTDTFALPLKPVEPRSLDWFCDNIPNVAGIIHLMRGYWRLHAREMPEGVYDAEALQAEGYQISIDGAPTTYIFIGY